VKFKIPLGDKSFFISAWKIGDEKNAILSLESEDNNEVIDTFFNTLIKERDILEQEPLTNADKVFILLMSRIRSAGDTIDLEYTCPECKKYTQTSVSISNGLTFNKQKVNYKINNKEYSIYNGLNLEDSVFYNNTKVSVDILDNLSLEEYSEIEKEFKKLTQLKLELQSVCPICNHTSLATPIISEILKDYILSVDLKTLYQMEVKLKMTANFSLQEIENMYPFEQDLYLNLVIKYNKEEK
jgi:transcription elongation factor Elf1